MIRVSNIPLGLREDFSGLGQKLAKILKISPSQIADISIVKQSVDARKKQQIHYTLTVDVTLHDQKEAIKLLKRPPSKHISAVNQKKYRFPPVARIPKKPVIVGMGPSGLMTALFLARAGIPSVILERGEDVERRSLRVKDFMEHGTLCASSNIQFGEGGAGTFSDGKLTTGTKDERQSILLQVLVEAGAPPDILYDHKPHIGTDVLRDVVKNIRLELLAKGCDIRFGHQMVDILSEGDVLTGLTVEAEGNRYDLEASDVVLATGHSARDTFTMLQEKGIPLEGKGFAIGVRMEHLQSEIGFAQYGEDFSLLPPTDYKLACHLPSGRSAFSFCVCPGGEVVGATSKEGHLVTNGMSYRARDNVNINGGLLIGVTVEDFSSFGAGDPLAGMYFQEHWEKIAFTQGGSDYRAPCQLVGDFLRKQASTHCGDVIPTYKPGVRYGEMDPCLPSPVVEALRESIPLLGQKVRGFDSPEAVMTGIETRSSSPVRILRDSLTFQSTLKGLYPCGEGAGYAGGIVSAGVDGIKIAEAMVSGKF